MYYLCKTIQKTIHIWSMINFIKNLFKGVTVHNEPVQLDEVKMAVKVSKTKPVDVFGTINTTGVNTGDSIFTKDYNNPSVSTQSKSKNEAFNKLVGEIKNKHNPISPARQFSNSTAISAVNKIANQPKIEFNAWRVS